MPAAPATQVVEKGKSLEPRSSGKIVRVSFLVLFVFLIISLKFGGCWAAMAWSLENCSLEVDWI